MIRQILETELVHNLSTEEITHVYFYGAGCSTSNNRNMIRSSLLLYFPGAHAEVHHDVLGSARALLGNEKGIACILGTGCNSCYYDGTEVFSVIPSLGYLFGDEGAGSYLGKKLIGAYLKNELPAELHKAFTERYLFSLEDILNSLYNKPFPHRYLASFSYFIKDHISHPWFHDLVSGSFTDFFTTHIIRYENHSVLPVGLVGSVAFQYRDILQDVAAGYGINPVKILSSPVDGLVGFHSGRK
jgi:N-acetylglucosamine kinase-like BadF-type ATPase